MATGITPQTIPKKIYYVSKTCETDFSQELLSRSVLIHVELKKSL